MSNETLNNLINYFNEVITLFDDNNKLCKNQKDMLQYYRIIIGNEISFVRSKYENLYYNSKDILNYLEYLSDIEGDIYTNDDNIIKLKRILLNVIKNIKSLIS